MKFIDDFIKAEESKMNWFDKIVRNYPNVRTTKSISYSLTNFKFDNEKVIRPSLWDKVISLIVLFFLSIVWVGLFKMILEYKFPFVIFLFGFLLVTLIISIILNNSFFNKKYIYNIIINREGITVDSYKFFWTDIMETCILNRQEGRRTNYYLVIFKRDKTIEKFDLFRMAISDKKLATIIEYYKTIED